MIKRGGWFDAVQGRPPTAAGDTSSRPVQHMLPRRCVKRWSTTGSLEQAEQRVIWRPEQRISPRSCALASCCSPSGALPAFCRYSAGAFL